MRALRIAAAFLGAASLAACSDRPEPIEPIGATILRLRIVAGDERPADTILTRRTLVVEARDRRGRLVSNVPVVAYSGHLQLSDPAARATAPATCSSNRGSKGLGMMYSGPKLSASRW